MTHEAEKFEAEMNRTCPVHGFRRLGIIVTMTIIESDGTVAEESVKLRQLVDTYHLRLSQLPKSSCELEDDSEELDERYEIHIFVPAPATVGIRRTFQNRKHGFAQQYPPRSAHNMTFRDLASYKRRSSFSSSLGVNAWIAR